MSRTLLFVLGMLAGAVVLAAWQNRSAIGWTVQHRDSLGKISDAWDAAKDLLH